VICVSTQRIRFNVLSSQANRLAARHRSPYSRSMQLARIAWSICHAVAFRRSPRILWGWRRFLLRCFRATVDRTARIHPSVWIEMPWNVTIGSNTSIGSRATLYSLGSIEIGNDVTISQNAHLCAGTHDHRLASMPLRTPPIAIDDHAWIAADAFVGPGVTVQQGALLGARGCAFEDLQPWTIYRGNPAVAIGNRTIRENSTAENSNTPTSSTEVSSTES
jgi:putative colanic acid biosynthesis acetyltransferase WcaF